MNYNQKYVIKIIFTILIVVLTKSIHAQSYERHEAVLAYLYQFPKHVEWKNEKQYKNFHFHVISDDQELIGNFKKVSETLKIKNKPVKITTSSKVSGNYSDVRAIFISKDKVDLYLDVFDKIEGKQILLISDSYADKRFVMINMYDSEESSLVFEINKANIINQRLNISDEILLLGGNMIDVAELYRRSQQSLRGMEKELENYKIILDSLNQQIDIINQTIEGQKEEIQDQKDLINNQKAELEEQLNEIENQKKLVLEQKNVLNQQKNSIQKQSIILSATKKQLNNQKDEILNGKEILKKH